MLLRSQKKVTTNDKKNVVLNIVASEKPKPPPNVEEDMENNDENNDDDDFLENEYTFPSSLNENSQLKKLHEKLVDSIEKAAPDLENILKLKIRFKRKKELLEWYYIYRGSFPNSEERLSLKQDIDERIILYKQEYVDFQKNSGKFKEMEKMGKRSNNLSVLREKLLTSPIDEYNRNILTEKLYELQNRDYHDEEYFKLFHWFKYALELPFDRVKSIESESSSALICSMKSQLDKYLYGMDKVKEQILLYFHNKITFPLSHTQPLGLVGPPGVGKTSIGIAISKLLELPFRQISLGGVTHADFMKGHDYTFVGSKPGEISMSLIELQAKNGIIFFDEFDKICENKDIVNSLLHIMDTSQNKKFKDNFFGNLQLDLSNIWFMCSMNEKPQDKALSDRVFFIEVPSYKMKEKELIVQNYLLPNSLQNIGMKCDDVTVSEDVIREMIQMVSNEESGVRTLKQAVDTIISKAYFLYTCQQNIKTSFLLPEKYYPVMFPFKVDSFILRTFLKDFSKRPNPSAQYMYI
jgi:ATP-dependent Lon protease